MAVDVAERVGLFNPTALRLLHSDQFAKASSSVTCRVGEGSTSQTRVANGDRRTRKLVELRSSADRTGLHLITPTC